MSNGYTERRDRWAREAQQTIKWIDPVALMPGARVKVCGVCSDCDPGTARRYGVKL